MALLRRLICAGLLAACTIAILASAASAATFYVNQRNGESTPNCGRFAGGHTSTKENPCATIHEAIEKTEGTAPPNTIKVSAEVGAFNESLALTTLRDKQLTIEGEEPGVVVDGHLTVSSPADQITLANVELHAESTTAAVADADAGLRLLDDTVRAESVTNGIEAGPGGSLAVEGGEVILESATGYAISAISAPLTVSGVTIANGDGGIGSESGGIDSRKSSLTVSDTTVSNEASSKPTQFGIVAESDSSTSIDDTTVKQSAPGVGVIFELSPATVEGLNVEMMDPASKVEAIDLETIGGSSTLSHVETSGKWIGPAVFADAGNVTLTDSQIETNLAAKEQAVRYTADEATSGLTVQRSVLRAADGASSVLAVVRGNATLDSSEIFGGASGVSFKNEAEGTRTLTAAASTIAAAPGLSFEKPGVVGIDAEAPASHSTANVAIEGSIVFQSQLATVAGSGHATVTCTYSAVPSQIQTAKPGASGEIGCAAGTSGNTNFTAEAASMFANPLISYELSPTSSAVDSVPASAIALPFGITPSATDVAGEPRVVDGNGDCIAVQDKGALELQGHERPCVPFTCACAPGVQQLGTKPKGTTTLAAVITGLTISPSAFFAAPFGPTISKPPKKKSGAKIAWRDSLAATTTLTILRQSVGRRQGKSCAKPSRRNGHGKRCTLLSKVGAFSHVDKAGVNSIHFSGRISGRKLAPGSYLLRAVPRNAAGVGTTVSKPFKIK